MSDHSLVERTVQLVNEQGLHMRPADTFVRAASGFESDIQIQKDDHIVDGKSILSILTLAADQGSELRLIAKGHDAERAITQLAELIESGFAELAGEH